MNWRTDKPTKKVIVAKLTEDFCHIKDNYSLLYLTDKPYQHYCEYGEEIPYSAIEKWASLEEDKLPEGLEEAAEEYACQGIPDGMKSAFKPLSDEIAKYFIAGAEWQKEQMGKQARKQLAKDEITLADLVAFDEGFSLGRRLERQEILENAVEHYVIGEIAGSPVGPAIVHYDENLNIGDKVKVIIVK